MAQAQILVVDDEPDIRELMREILEDEGYGVEVAANGEAARVAFAANSPDLVLLDIWMPDVDGITLLKEWSESGRLDCPVVMISGHGTLETAVEATRLGAHDFVQKPLSLAKLLATVKQALGSYSGPPQATPVAQQENAIDPQGSSPQMQLLRQKAEQAARHESPVLITGEAGSGKASLAAYIHRSSGVPGPYVTLDLCQLSGDNMRAYLLGQSTASGHQPGALDAASRGTLFIPEIHTLDPDCQSLLGLVLEAGSFTPEGGTEQRPLGCRVIAGAEGSIEQQVRDGQVLDQLYLLLNVLPLHMPALRERPQDIPELVQFYTDWFSNNENLSYRNFSISALNRLRNVGWPGNERELRNMVQRLLILGGDGEVSVQEVDEAIRHPSETATRTPVGIPDSFDLPLREAREQFEREYLIYQLKKAGGSVGKLSAAVGMERTHLYRKLRSLGIDPKSINATGGPN
jgi:DNA-binding NtrC family response regulator